jgi:aromatic amino acid aminotransferase I
MEGYIRWLRGIKSTYKQRRDWICDAFGDVFHLEVEGEGVREVQTFGKGVTCYMPAKAGTGAGVGMSIWDEKRGVSVRNKGPALVSFIPPTGR